MNIQFLFLELSALAVVLITCPLRGPGRVLGPTGLTALMLVSIFGVRPFLASYNNYDLYGLDAHDGAGFAVKAGSVGLIAFTVGCLLASRRASYLGDAVAPQPRAYTTHDRALMRLAWLAVLGGLLTVGVLFAFGGPAAASDFFLNGRSAALTRLLTNLPTFFSMISFLGSAGASAYIALCLTTRPKLSRQETAVIIFSVSTSFLLNVSTGSRRALIPIVLVPVSTLFLSRRGRVTGRALIAGTVALLFFATLPFVRSEGARPDSNVFAASVAYATGGGLNGVAKGFFLSYDTEMFNYVAYVGPRLGSTIPYAGGKATFGELLTFPLPSRLAPNSNYSDQMLTRLYGGGCGDPVCPVPSAVGVLLFDFGLSGVALGMIPIGYFYRRVELRISRGLGALGLLLAGIITGYAPIFIRTYSPDAVWWELYYATLALAAFRVLRRPSVQDENLVQSIVPAAA